MDKVKNISMDNETKEVKLNCSKCKYRYTRDCRVCRINQKEGR